MAGSPHYSELLRGFNSAGVEYLVVGAHAVMKYGEPRFTKDLDIWVNRTPDNAARVYRALAEFGAPLKQDGVDSATFAGEQVVYQIGIAPVRIDVSTHIDGVEFADAWQRRERGTMFGVETSFLSLADLITNKRATGRERDQEDLKALEKRLLED